MQPLLHQLQGQEKVIRDNPVSAREGQIFFRPNLNPTLVVGSRQVKVGLQGCSGADAAYRWQYIWDRPHMRVD